MSDGIGLQIVAAVPPAVVAGESNLFTIDVKHDGSRWPYAREEHVLHCIAGASPGLQVEALGTESMVLHRFGGTYGGITYKLTADGTQPSGRLIIKLLNSAGITLGTARLPIEVDTPAAPDLADFEEHEPPAEPLPPFSGHYVHVVTETEYVPSAKDELSRLLGQRLATSGVGLVLGSGSRLDNICAEAYVDALGGDPGARVVSFVEEVSEDPERWTQMVTPGRERRQRSCSIVAMAVVLFGEGSDASAASAAASALGHRVLTLPDAEASSAAAIADAIEAVVGELEDMVDTHQWPRPGLARQLSWRDLSSRLQRTGLIRNVIDLDPDDDGTLLAQVLQSSVPLGTDRAAIPFETVAWAKDRIDVPDLALAMELLVGLGNARVFSDLTSGHGHDALTAAAELAEMYIHDNEGRTLLYSWRAPTVPTRSGAPPLFVDGLPVIGRAMLWDYLWDLADGDIETLIVTGEKQSGKTFTLRLIRELVRSLGPEHRLISLRLTDARLSSFVAMLEPYLGPDRTESDDANAYVRIQRRLRDFVTDNPGVITWFAIDCAGQRTDAELSYLFPGLLGLAALPDVRLVLIDTDFVPGGEDRAVEVRLTPPDRNDVRAFLTAAYPKLDPAIHGEIVALADHGWEPLLDRIDALDDLEATDAASRPEQHVIDAGPDEAASSMDEAISGLGVVEQDARERRDALERLASEYNLADQGRRSQGRTARLEDVVERAIEQASAHPVSAEQLRALYEDLELRPGGRVVALAACVSLGAAAPFDLLASSLGEVPTDQEYAFALDILARLLDTGLWWQADDAVLTFMQQAETLQRRDARKVVELYRRNCGLPESATFDDLRLWSASGQTWRGVPRRMALFGSTQPETDAFRRYWLRRLADELGAQLAGHGWELVAGKGVGIGENAVASAVHAGGKATLLIGRRTEDAKRIDLPPYARIVGITASALLEHVKCAIAIGGREGTDAECNLALLDRVPVLLTDTRASGWPHEASARAVLIERGVPESLLAVLDDAPDDAAEYARRIVRLANCVRRTGIAKTLTRDEREALIRFLDGMTHDERTELFDSSGWPSRVDTGEFIDACEAGNTLDTLVGQLIAKFQGTPELDELLTALGYRTV